MIKNDYMDTATELSSSPKSSPRIKAFLFFILLVCFAIIYFCYQMFLGPRNFNVPINEKLGGVLVEVRPGMGGMELARKLKSDGVIGSVSLFGGLLSIFGDSKKIVAGYYLFKHPVGVLEAETRIRKGDFGLQMAKVTFPEGFTLKQVVERLDANLPLFDKEKFMALASTSEGYLFPETYFFLPTDNEEIIFKKMRSVFDEETAKVFATSTRQKDEIIKMASIIEKEVRGPDDMRIVSGILWKRMKIGMALQVDATLAYERGLTSAELRTADLEKDSPYNTYTNRGLPPTPIDNPGLNAIIAAINPVESPYLYFLTDEEGKVYYAKTFEQHKVNKAKYL